MTPMRIQAMHGRLLGRCSFQALVMAPMKGGLQIFIMLHVSPDDALACATQSLAHHPVALDLPLTKAILGGPWAESQQMLLAGP